MKKIIIKNDIEELMRMMDLARSFDTAPRKIYLTQEQVKQYILSGEVEVDLVNMTISGIKFDFLD